MASITPDPRKIRTFASQAAFEKWMSQHHDRETEVWIKIHKKQSGLKSITPAEALEVALCWGWIDAIRKGFDEYSFLQRYTRRGRKSMWSQINREHVARLTAAGRMTPHGQREIDAAKADGRWDRAYAPQSQTTAASMPADLLAAIHENAKARRTFDKLNRQNLFALAFRVSSMKTPAGRAKKIATLVKQLEAGTPIVPPPTARTTKSARNRS